MKTEYMYKFLCTLLLVLSFYTTVNACSCNPITVDKAYNEASIVFLARVIKVELKNDNPNVPPALRRYFDYALVTLEVDKIWKGHADSLIQIRTGLGKGDCGVVFKVGFNFLVYAYPTPNGLCTDICSRSGDEIYRRTDIEELDKKYPIKSR